MPDTPGKPSANPSDQDVLGPHTTPRRGLSGVLLRITLTLALVLGVLAALLQLWLDLNQQKNAVEISAQEFLDGVVPSAASAAYNFQYEAANQVVKGLFSQRAIKQVVIINGDEVMVDQTRAIAPTLPRLMQVTEADHVTISRVLQQPNAGDAADQIGAIRIVVDRSIVPPTIVDRMLSYFGLAVIKNIAFGLALVLLVYGSLARHLVRLVEEASGWRPDQDAMRIPKPPRFLIGTEIELLGEQIKKLSGSALEVIRLKSEREQELSMQSDMLHEMVQLKTQELEAANKKLIHLAQTDALTQLLNRGALDQKLDEITAAAESSGATPAVAIMDIDCFKAYNDTYGHQQGDQCLKQVAAALADVAKAQNCIVGRYGGEEFLMVKSGASATEMMKVADRIHAAVKALDIAHEAAPEVGRVTVSIGLSTTRSPPQSPEVLVGEADRALYDAKAGGRNRTVQFEPRSNPTGKARRSSDPDIGLALREERFVPFFQPQIDVRSGAIVGAEALARLPFDGEGCLPPAAFLPQLIENGTLSHLDRIMIAKTKGMLERSAALGVVVPGISFNVYPRLLRDDAIVTGLAELSTISKTMLAVELLEMWSSEDLGESEHFALDRLREAGFQIDIDDFGTSKASVISLHHVNPDRIKIARELIAPLPQSPEFQRSVACILDIANAQGVSVIAEGVETENHVECLKALGCCLQQGFHFAAPLPEHDFLDFVRAHESGVARLLQG